MADRRFAVLLFAAIACCQPASLRAQQERGRALERGVAVIHPDSLRVGEEFQLGLTAISAERLQFPAVLSLTLELEQIGPPRIDTDTAGVWKAVYPLVAWKSGRIQPPAVRIPVIGGREERWLEIRPPAFEVLSVLPPASEQPRLLPPRIPAERRGIRWSWLLALLLLALLARELLSRRRPLPVPVADNAEMKPDPLTEARAALLRLREQASAGRMPAAILYDEVESVVRTFLVRTRGWPEQVPVRSALQADVEDLNRLDVVVRRALPARFGALAVSGDTQLADIDSVISWLDTRTAA